MMMMMMIKLITTLIDKHKQDSTALNASKSVSVNSIA